MSGKITVFMAAGCSRCDEVRDLLTQSGATDLLEVDVEMEPGWKPLLFLLTKGIKLSS